MSGILIIAENRKARHDYDIISTKEAGLVLTGSEVKSLRNRQLQLKDSYVVFRQDEAFLQNAHISEYRASSYNNHAPERARKLLLSRVELTQLKRKMDEKGFSLVPLKVYFLKGWAKVEIALVKGRNKGDKRQAIKEKDVKRQLNQEFRRSR